VDQSPTNPPQKYGELKIYYNNNNNNKTTTPPSLKERGRYFRLAPIA